MKQFLLLARVLRKVGSGKEKTNGNQEATNYMPLYATIGIALAVGLYLGGGYIADLAPMFGGTGPLFNTFFLAVAAMLLFWNVMDLVGTLYMSTDLPALLCLPFSARQIVLARTMNACMTKALLASAAVLPFGIGYGMKTAGTGLFFWLGLVLADILIPLMMTALAAILVILIMSVFHVIRSRDMLAIIGAVLGIGLSIGITVVINGHSNMDQEQTNQLIGDAVGSLAGASVAVPAIPLLVDVMTGGNPLQLLAALGIAVLHIIIFLLVSDALYLRSALTMQDTSGNAKRLDATGFAKACRQKSIRRAYMMKDVRMTLRSPAYMSNGWLMTLIWPVLLLIGFVTGQNSELIKGMVPSADNVLSQVGLCIGLPLLAAFSASCLSCLGTVAMNREGASFYYMKMLPLSYKQQICAKRDAVLAISSVGSVGYVLVAAIVGVVLGMVNVLWALYAVALTALLLFALTNVLVVHGLRKPNLNWEAESSVAKVGALNVILWVFALLIGIVVIIVGGTLGKVEVPGMDMAQITNICLYVAGGMLLLGILGAWLSQIWLGHAAEKKLAAL